MCARHAPQRQELAAERHRWILETLENKSSIKTAEICAKYNISPVTARADLKDLEKLGSLERVHGGAVSLHRSQSVVPPMRRATYNSAAKTAIAKIASDLVNDGDSIIVDTGTTALEFVRHLDGKKNLTVVTNDITILEYMEEHLPLATPIILGGTFRRSHRYTYGTITTSSLNSLFLDKVFLAANSFIPEVGFMTEFEPVCTVKRCLLSHAKYRYILMDSSKIGVNSFMRFAGVDDFDGIVLEKDPNQAMQSLCDGNDRKTKVLTPTSSGASHEDDES